MRSTLPLWWVATLAVLVASSPVVFAQAPATPSTPPAGTRIPNRWPSPSSPPKSPYRTLFGAEVRVSEALQKAATAERAAKAPSVVCGMAILPADPSIDPNIFLKGAPSDTGHAIRSIPPPVCR